MIGGGTGFRDVEGLGLELVCLTEGPGLELVGLTDVEGLALELVGFAVEIVGFLPLILFTT